MWFRGQLRKLTVAVMVLTIAFSVQSAPGQSHNKKEHDKKEKDKKVHADGRPVLWREPVDIASRNLLLGPGGDEMKPNLDKVSFVEEVPGGYSKKYRVRDGSGREWVAKISKEAQSETAATRLLWAAGYYTDVNYLVPAITIEGKGAFENVRFEARSKDVTRLEEWKWDENPFVGTVEFQGFKIMMVLLDNWDIKDSNNKILLVRNQETGENELRYIVSDLGATLGKTGWIISRSRNKPNDFVKAKFIDDVKGNRVDFHYSGKRKGVFDDITVDQAKWIGDLLSRLSDEQISDAFRAANYNAEEVQMLAGAMKARISELVALPQKQSASRERAR